MPNSRTVSWRSTSSAPTRRSRPSASRSSSPASSSTIRCATSAAPAPVGGCELVRDGDVYRAVISPLEPGQGITIGGTIVGLTTVDEPPIPELPERHADHRGRPGAGDDPARPRQRRPGVRWSPAGAAATRCSPVGPPTPPTARSRIRARRRRRAAAVRLVPDDEMDELATIEFVPPKGIAPWQGAVLLTERIDNATVGAWFSGLAAREGITLDKAGHDLVLGSGPKRGRARPDGSGAHRQDPRRPRPHRARHVRQEVRDRVDRRPQGSGDVDRVVGLVATPSARRHGPAREREGGRDARRDPRPGLLRSRVVHLRRARSVRQHRPRHCVRDRRAGDLRLLPVPRVAAVSAARPDRHWRCGPSRSAASSRRARASTWTGRGSRVCSASTAPWAVALGAAGAWSKALNKSQVPPAEAAALSHPMLIYSMGSSISSSYTAPSSSGSGSSGGSFSGGSVGGGGGGGSSGSW